MKRLFLLVLCLMLLVSMVGCRNSAQGKQNEEAKPTEEPTLATDPTTEEPSSQAKWYLTQLTDDCAASVELPDFIMEEEALKQLVFDYIDSQLADYAGDFELTLSNEDVTAKFGDYLYQLDLDCRTTYLCDEFASLVFEGLYNYKSAAHPVHELFALNINRLTNERVKLKDIWLVNDKFYEIYQPYAREKLASILADEYKDVPLEQFVTKESFLAGLETEKEYCVYYTQSGMVVSCPTSHAIGHHLDVEVPYEKLYWRNMPYDAITELETTASLCDGRFTVISKGRYSWCNFYDLKGNLIKEEYNGREPHIVQLNENVVGYWIQGGTGPSTRWSYFYDGTSGTISKEFTWFLDATSDKVVCGNIDGVTVYSIFDDSYCYEITDFEYPLPKLGVESVIDAEFSEDGKSVIVEYYKNNKFEKETQTFELP